MIRLRSASAVLVLAVTFAGCQPAPTPQPPAQPPAATPATPAAPATPAEASEKPAQDDGVASWAEKSGATVRTDGEGRIALIDFAKASITDEDLQRLADQEYLKELRLGGCPIGDAGLQALAGLPRLVTLKTLKTLHVTRTKVTEDGAKKLAEALPGCEILSGDPDQK